ncbi:restriction endonuclease subunit S [Pseudoxanthomonas suwonensis]|uniref:restriction endonuclease subunit S n=1 Tax=Pseudoxanthomonas suwonensis TaxID=314722 RepID=UPI00138F6907|nr:restriction endonuclease subunit S [Pseudoxanthomonas suwonensis]KAF1705573.1 restriction endonuclease [Pseudoxanthomonas suwonensis]
MSLPRYPDYKDSGVAWLGKMPAHWDVAPLKRFLDIENGADYKAIEADEGYPVLGSGGRFASATDYIYDGESVLLGRKGTIDKPLYVTGRFWTVDTMYWSRIRSTACGRYCYYAATTIPFGMYSTNTALPSMTKGALDAHRMSCPPLGEQRAISRFLDRETAKVDALIAEQEKLLALLAEKRQATISHAVTRGLDPNVPMKDSGIAWLGEVPVHWNTSRLKYLTDAIFDCPHSTPIYDADGAYLVIRTADLDRGVLIKEDLYRVSQSEYEERIRRSRLEEGDIVYGREGERWGHAALVPESDRYCLGQRMMQFRPSAEVCPRFLMWQLNSVGIYRQGELDTVGATSPHVNVSTIRNFQLTVPPLVEQKAIAAFLERVASSFDSLDAEARRAIDLLRERRSVLIAAAVTGQIDVRGLGEAEAA